MEGGALKIKTVLSLLAIAQPYKRDHAKLGAAAVAISHAEVRLVMLYVDLIVCELVKVLMLKAIELGSLYGLIVVEAGLAGHNVTGRHVVVICILVLLRDGLAGGRRGGRLERLRQLALKPIIANRLGNHVDDVRRGNSN